MSSRSPSGPSRVPIEGHRALPLFQLAPDKLHLNHGSYGALPQSVAAEQERIRADIERDPTSFFNNVLPGELRRLAGLAAQNFGGEATDWVFVENATFAVSSILSSFPVRDGDEILTTSHAYGAVLKAMRVYAARQGAKLVVAAIPSIVEGEDQIVEAIAQSFSPRTKLLIVDHITSPTAIVFPVARIAKLAHAAGIAVLVDGAHAPGHI
ncbi:MAG TPA: aminotransferase class V-fold PLP-dependent enzyme, partial [Rhizomicrobium sp.]|nr:aminotransferase class V-fold PLP-dependent enzyme [Rhizomicrobium sp.]